ncbi:hypothetical protein [Aquabacterium sp. J223]|uniref:hypothetical protein n=1 Tax=Aquabacterium sp. J223 TaxID=2898431 RepID=UPI0021AD7A04|nr:hypothetical protein [Aquabacterium sp. J223]UUX94916.1 hypothetical protein LRS07_16895 [Aquabacterium sp. J223]
MPRLLALLVIGAALHGPLAAQPQETTDPGSWTGPRYGPARQTAPDARRESLSVFSEARAECRQGATGRDERRECMREAVRQDDGSLRRLPAPRSEGQLQQAAPTVAAPAAAPAARPAR